MRALIGLVAGLFISLLLTALVGENPLTVLQVILRSAVGSLDDLALTLFYSTSLIFTGLAVAMAFRAGLFNIGAEGQLSISALALAALAPHVVGWSPLLFLPLALITTICAGLLWGLIPGWIRAYRGGHEVVVTMMLNFVAAGVVNYFVVGALRDPESQSPETLPLPENLLLRAYDPLQRSLPDSPLNSTFLLALFCCFALWFFLRGSRFGFHLRALSGNPVAAATQGIDTRKLQLWAMALAGAFASGVALNEVLGNSGKLKLGFSADFGFVGIAVALLARNHPLAVIPSAILFGVLTKGTGDLDIETESITRDFTRIMQAVIILSISVASFLQWPFSRKSEVKK